MVLDLFSPRRPMRVQPFYGFRTSSHLHLTARALRAKETSFDSRHFLGGLKTMLRQYLSHEVEGVDVALEFETGDGRTVRSAVTTNSEGFARFEVPLGERYDLPLKTGWERARLSWGEIAGRHEGGEADAHLLVPGREAGIGVISDIDDTILETGITGNVRAIARNWKRVMAQMPDDREIVPGAKEFYGALGGSQDPEPGQSDIPQARPRPVFYVSSSPWNLFTYLVTFKRTRGMPLGPIMLRDWGFNRKTLGSEGHGSHKTNAIRRIITGYPELKFALVGDDTQKDLVAFGEIVAEHQDRVAAVFIRRISAEAPNEKEQAAKIAIDAAGVPFWMGADYNAARDFLSEAGLEMDAPVENLVKAAAEGETR